MSPGQQTLVAIAQISGIVFLRLPIVCPNSRDLKPNQVLPRKIVSGHMKNTRFLQSWTFLALIFGLAGFVRADAGARVTYLTNDVQAHGLNGSPVTRRHRQYPG